MCEESNEDRAFQPAGNLLITQSSLLITEKRNLKMRDLSTTAINTIEITDGLTGDVHEIFYRVPTNEERAAYMNGAVQRKGKKIMARLFENRLKFGERIITGFTKGTLGVDGKAFSSDADDPDYRADWKSLLIENAADIVAAVAVSVFEGTGIQNQPDLEVDPLDE